MAGKIARADFNRMNKYEQSAARMRLYRCPIIGHFCRVAWDNYPERCQTLDNCPLVGVNPAVTNIAKVLYEQATLG